MAMRAGINRALLKGLCVSPPKWAREAQPSDLDDGTEPYFLSHPKVVALAKAFLSSTTDSVRLCTASRLSRRILGLHDLDELEDLRLQLQIGELLRVIPYGRQTDHSAHTLYLYLVGVYLFVYSESLHDRICKQLRCEAHSVDAIRAFLFRWMYAGLLHDIGYVFQGRKTQQIRAVDRLFRGASIGKVLRDWGESPGRIRTILTDFRHLQPWQRYEHAGDPESSLDALRHVPWGERIGHKEDGFEIVKDCLVTERSDEVDWLEQYAYSVAASGYDGASEGVVDHAVASGLLLIQYCSMWYYFAHLVGYEGKFGEYRGSEYLGKHIVPACFAAACHNMIGEHAADAAIEKIEMDSDPILSLGVLCDELQRWDRFPAGEKLLRRLESYEEKCADSERLQLKCRDDGLIVIGYPRILLDSVKESLDARLGNWKSVIKLRVV